MADITWDDVVALQANLSSVAEAAQDMILDYVNEDLNPTAFGGEDSARYVLARCYLAAHLGELVRGNGAGGAVASETISSTSISLAYARATTSGDGLLQTSWGTQYAALVRQSTLRIGGGRTR